MLDDVESLNRLYHGITSVWPQVTKEEFVGAMAHLAESYEGNFITIERLIDDLLEVFIALYGAPKIALLTRPAPFNMGALNN